jgi:4'-phosphopantetheinyl transferase
MTLLNCPWPAAPDSPVLAGNEVHIWCAAIAQPEVAYFSLLSPDERTRARHFRFERERRRFVVGRGILRTILGRYLNLPPEKLQFKYETSGKPALAGKTSLHFNLAHSGDLALYAFTRERELGIDLEEIHPVADVQQLVEQFFSPIERAELAALPPDRMLEAFFSGWTRKEAYLKARGIGLTYPLDQFSVSMASEKPAKLLSVRDGSEKLSRWSLRTLTPIPASGYIATLAVEGQAWRLLQWQMQPQSMG